MFRFVAESAAAVPLHAVTAEGLEDWRAGLGPEARRWLETVGFAAGIGETALLPDPGGTLHAAVAGLGTAAARQRSRFHLAAAAPRLPAGTYRLAAPEVVPSLEAEVHGWLMAGYRFDRYRPAGAGTAAGGERRLVAPSGIDAGRIETIAGAMFRAQDLVNTPAADLGPDELEAAVREVGAAHGAEVSVTTGPALESGFPMIAAVGRAAARPPRLVDLVWGDPGHPKVTLVGKGVCFDTGGLNIKPGASMGLMKKDMGGAAAAIGLAEMVMALGLGVRLRLLVPAVENAISGAAMRPGDILRSRKGLTVEVNNTDAEGRLVLADALALAAEEAPALVVSLATLTGAARVALGPDLPALFTDDEDLAALLARTGAETADPLWRLPFWTPYEPLIEPGIADLDNAPSGGMAGAITAALFLRRFAGDGSYAHLDLYAWTPQARPGRPKGGAAQTARALLAALEARFG